MRFIPAVLISILLFATSAFATAQFSELLERNGVPEKMFSEPLESYFSAEHPRPDMFRGPMCTACWRGYVGKWKIEDGYLYLVSLHKCCTSEPKTFPLDGVNPEWKSPVKATWFTGTLRIVQGKMLNYRHMGFQSQYERDLFIEIKAGKVISEKVVDNTGNATKQDSQQ